MTDNNARLARLIQQMIADLDDEDCYYWLHSNYFDIQRGGPPSPTERTVTRWWQAPLFLDYDAFKEPLVVDDGLFLNVILKNQLPAEWERIKIGFDQIWSLKRFYKSQTFVSEQDALRYHNREKLRMPPLGNFDDGADKERTMMDDLSDDQHEQVA